VCQADDELFGRDKAKAIALFYLHQWRDTAIEKNLGQQVIISRTLL